MDIFSTSDDCCGDGLSLAPEKCIDGSWSARQLDAFNEGFHARTACHGDCVPDPDVACEPELLGQWHRGRAAAILIGVLATCDCGDAGRCLRTDACGSVCLIRQTRGYAPENVFRAEYKSSFG
ncbi:hypothetical protein GCM10011572_50540 [Pseudoduganella buxea]|uniref:Uncharacterized protein n=1 Tax=Pseudoduganella buxea TaxID=1949069 RepID=A0ABQ1LG75_9BURK|nr:hypothetical protein GCM10011572_50540 [Pseudoduganella buxea]